MEYTTVKASSKLTIVPAARKNDTCFNIRKAGICLSKSYCSGQNVEIQYIYNVIQTHLKNTCKSKWVNLSRAANRHENVRPVRNLCSPSPPNCSIKVVNPKALKNRAAMSLHKNGSKAWPTPLEAWNFTQHARKTPHAGEPSSPLLEKIRQGHWGLFSCDAWDPS